MNLTGMVKYVSKFDSGGSIFVGLKIDHPGKEATMSRMAPRLSSTLENEAGLNGRNQ